MLHEFSATEERIGDADDYDEALQIAEREADARDRAVVILDLDDLLKLIVIEPSSWGEDEDYDSTPLQSWER
jgi:hypothetical protein